MGTAELEQLARRLHCPVDSVQAYAALDPTQLSQLDRCVEAALAQRQAALDAAYARLLPSPLRGLLLRLLRR
jgi:hypothetical protein